MAARCALVVAMAAAAAGHGLMTSPASRNQLQRNGDGKFMSVLTHGPGRKGKKSTHVCGFDSETWHGGATPWDAAKDWPTVKMQSGNVMIRWNVFWGPHFDDTTDFRYWITKADFKFSPSRALTWDDFEDAPFCDLPYVYREKDSNPNVDTDETRPGDQGIGKTLKFDTFCSIPKRVGHHVIYGEWGRGPGTYERFHGCIDGMYDGTVNTANRGFVVPPPKPPPAASGKQCGPYEGCKDTPDCCPAGLQCFKEHDHYSQCRGECPKGWACETQKPAPKPVAPQPAPQPVVPQPGPQPVVPQPGPQPSTQKRCTTANDCMYGTGCYHRSLTWAECRKDCPNGWECSVNAAPSPAN